MGGLYTKLELTEHGRTCDTPWPQGETRRAVVDLLVHATRHRLVASQPWQLASRSARELEEACGYAPAGGWSRFAALCAGAGWLSAEVDHFAATEQPADAAQRSDELTAQALVEAFTRQLSPPQVMAGMLVGLDLHPMWGLRVAHHVRTPERSERLRDAALFPRPTLHHVETMVFGTIAGVVSLLRELDAEATYPLDAVGQVCASSARNAREATETRLVEGAVPVFLADAKSCLPLDVFHHDLVESVLVPAGVARLTADARIQVRSGWLKQVRVGNFETREVDAWGAWHDTPKTCRCAC